MAMVEMQTNAALAESRRKMQARRRLKNRIALTLSMATMAFGLFWLIWILMSTITRGIDGMSLALFTEMTPPPNTEGGGLANALAGSGLLILWATVCAGYTEVEDDLRDHAESVGVRDHDRYPAGDCPYCW